MPWIEAVLNGQKVLARCNERGEFVAEGGRVEVRYKPTDGRAYRAGKGNLQPVGLKILPDAHCAEAGAAASAYQQKKEKKAAAAERVEEHPEGTIVAYTDGACSGNPGPAGSGVMIQLLDGKKVDGFRYLGDRATNNIAELTAIEMAIDAVADRAAPLQIRTDSGYSIGVLQKGWKAKANPELIKKIRDKLAERPKTRLQYVPGHAGVAGNERADELAREAITTRASKELPRV